jgi:hypothetical protein
VLAAGFVIWFTRNPFDTAIPNRSFRVACIVVYDICPRPFRYAVTAMSFGPNRFLSASRASAV